jgi:DNA/RNA-binding domain of Phe-tRNA-synthetase-like protein
MLVLSKQQTNNNIVCIRQTHASLFQTNKQTNNTCLSSLQSIRECKLKQLRTKPARIRCAARALIARALKHGFSKMRYK